MAERGVEVIGVDASASLLRRGQRLAAEIGTKVRWIRGDMRRLPFKTGAADAAIMMDVVGFFDTEDEHDRTFREAARVLRTGGRVGLKVLNGRHVLDAFRERDHEESDGTTISISRTLSLDPPRMVERLSFSGSRGREEFERWQRLYREDELRAALEDAGFAIVGVYAGPDGTPFEPARSSTIWIVGERRAMDDPPAHNKSRAE
jgi:ubiquinone/menaquinone biosynthesis C-methylase UbiE